MVNYYVMILMISIKKIYKQSFPGFLTYQACVIDL